VWELTLAVVQWICVGFLLVGAVLSLWFARLSAPAPRMEPKTIVVTEAVMKPLPPLKRAA
jgi:hypothetical protein